MRYKRILTVQDISCVGQCSSTVALPILSVCGFETGVLPCSLLSNHTTGFDDYSFKDLADEMKEIIDKWQSQQIKFSAVYSGYIGNISQLKMLEKVMDKCLEEGAVRIIDPAMADNGQLYPGFDDQFIEEVKALISKADYILPNVTEACLLTGTEYTEVYNQQFIEMLLKKLAEIGCKNIVLTGVSFDSHSIGVAIYTNGNCSFHFHGKVSRSSPGTGDVFASVFTGALLKGKNIFDSAEIASTFVVECLKETLKYPDHTYGPVFEPLLGKLIEAMNN